MAARSQPRPPCPCRLSPRRGELRFQQADPLAESAPLVLAPHTQRAVVVGQVMVWAAESPRAANEVFNVTNGDVFEWRSVWPAMAETFGVKTGPDEPLSLAAYIRDNADVWSEIVTRHCLAGGDLRAFVGQGDQHADFAFAYGAPAGPVAFVSTIKLRKAGFNAAIDTRDAFCAALRSFIDRRLCGGSGFLDSRIS